LDFWRGGYYDREGVGRISNRISYSAFLTNHQFEVGPNNGAALVSRIGNGTTVTWVPGISNKAFGFFIHCATDSNSITSVASRIKEMSSAVRIIFRV